MGRLPRIATGATVALLVLALAAIGFVGPPVIADQHPGGEDLPGNQSVPLAPPGDPAAEGLRLPERNQTTAEVGPAVSPGLATSHQFRNLEHAWESALFSGEVDEAATSEETVALLERYVEQLRQDVIDMNEVEQESFRAFERGDLTGEQLLARLAVLEQRGSLLRERLGEVREASRGVTSPLLQDNVTAIQSNVGWLQIETETFAGPIRTEAWSVLAGESTDELSVTVAATQNGYTLSRTDDVMFTREIYHAANYDRAGGGFLSTEEGGDRVAELYPWTYEQSFEQDPRVRGDIFREILTHPHGTLTTYLSGATELPYREIHETDLAAVPTTPGDSETAGNVSVELERTNAGGPAQVVVTTPGGEPIADATVAVDDRLQLETDADGVAWFTTAGRNVSVVVTTDGERVELTTALDVGEPPPG